MSQGSSRVYEYVEDKRFMGELSNPTAVGRSSIDGQPPHTTLYLRIDEDKIREARFQTSGCGFLIAAVGATIELALNRSVDDCREITEQNVYSHLGGLPSTRHYCITLALSALKDALSKSA